MRQLTGKQKGIKRGTISKLPMRQLTYQISLRYTVNFSKLPMRQLTRTAADEYLPSVF